MFKVEGTTITLTRGDTFNATITMKLASNNQTYTPQTGDVIKFYMRRDAMDLQRTRWMPYVSVPIITKTIPNDTLILHLDPDDTKSLPFGDYAYDIEITFANGDVDTFINMADFILAPEVDDGSN